MPTPTAAMAAMISANTATELVTAATSRASRLSKNQRFQWFMATVAAVERSRQAASPKVSAQARRALAPAPEAAGEAAEGGDHAGVELEARGVGGLQVLSAHRRSNGMRVGGQRGIRARRSGHCHGAG